MAGEQPPLEPRAPPDRVIYAIGDVHGRLDLLERLVSRIHDDIQVHGRPYDLIFLGDYIDRGPRSRGVLDCLNALKPADATASSSIILLRGNHEQALLDFLEDPEKGAPWLQHGGLQTLSDYGVHLASAPADAASLLMVRDEFAHAFPTIHRDLLAGLPLTAQRGDYLFVHAGVRPGVSLEDQKAHDLLWIRREFLERPTGLRVVVVHGHTPTEAPEVRRWRIGVDTGAYATGVLTAVRLADERQDFIQTGV